VLMYIIAVWVQLKAKLEQYVFYYLIFLSITLLN
jgi:hypothetical protein